VRAVNLIPNELRGAGGGAPGRSGGAVYVLLGALAAALVMVAVWGLAARTVTNKENELARVTAEAANAEQRAGALAPYQRFADLRAQRAATVAQLSRSRFNWPYALREVSRVLPGDTWLTSLVGTVAPGVMVEDTGSGGVSQTLRQALSVPAIQISGCSMSQSTVARYLASLREIEGVTRVSLASSEKADTQAGTSGGGGADGSDCRSGSNRIPKFELVVFFERSTATPSQTPAGAAAAPTTATPVQQETEK
jgi:Tfp pilus assembly protein PilN